MRRIKIIKHIACILLTAGMANAEIKISNPTGIPMNNIVISQTNETRGLQSRYTGEDDWRAAGQLFRWTSDERLAGLGLKFAANQGKLFSGSQDYVLSIQKIIGGQPMSNELVGTFTLTESFVSAGQWIHFDFDDVQLENGGWYVFVIAPAEGAVSENTISWAQQDSRDMGFVNYDNGRSSAFSLMDTAQMPPPTDGSYTYSYSNNQDLAFYMTALTEPTEGLLVAVSGGAARNLVPNSSFEVGPCGWMLTDLNTSGVVWGTTSEKEAPHGNNVLFVDQTNAAPYPYPISRTRILSSWLDHQETALVFSAMIRSDQEREVGLGFTHGEIGQSGASLEKKVKVGSEWHQVVLRIPKERNQPSEKDFGVRHLISRSSHTKGMVYFDIPASGKFWIDAVQVNEVTPLDREELPFTPAADVEMGWTVANNGIFHERPQFDVRMVCHDGARDWNGTLQYAIRDYFGHVVQEARIPVEIPAGCETAISVELNQERQGFYSVSLELTGSNQQRLAKDHLTFIYTGTGAGSDAIAITLSESAANNLFHAGRSISRLGFTQTRIYNMSKWLNLEPRQGTHACIESSLDKQLGDYSVKSLLNFQGLPSWLTGEKGRSHIYPLEHLDVFAKYVRRTVEKVHPWLSAASFVNEPNAHFRGPPGAYIEYMQALYNAVKSVAPQVDVVGIQAGSGSQGGGHYKYVRDMLAAGGTELIESMDVLAFQSHPAGELPFETTGWARLLADFRTLAQQYGIKRMWTTEMCYSAYAPEESHIPIRLWHQALKRVNFNPNERNQADWLTRSALYSLASTFERFYAFNYQAISPASGGLRPDGMTRYNYLQTPRPVLAALSVANRMIAGTDQREVRTFKTPGLWGGVFTGEERRVDALWSATGPQEIFVQQANKIDFFDAMGYPLPLTESSSGVWIELGESPVYLVSSRSDSDPVCEFVSVSWDPEEVWSQGLLQGTVALNGMDGINSIQTETLKIVESSTGRIKALMGDGLLPGTDAEQTLRFEFLVDVQPGPYPLELQGECIGGEIIRRRFVPVVLGSQNERDIFFSGEPALIENFSNVTGEGDAVFSPTGIRWTTELTFPWHSTYNREAERDLDIHDGFVRATVKSKVGVPSRGNCAWIAIDCDFDQPRNWLAYKGLRIRYRFDRETAPGDFQQDAKLSSAGIHIRLVDAEGNAFFTSSGHSGIEYRQDGDWHIAELFFDDVLSLNEKRAQIRHLSLVASPPADDNAPFGVSIDHVEVFTEKPSVEVAPPGLLPGIPTYDE